MSDLDCPEFYASWIVDSDGNTYMPLNKLFSVGMANFLGTAEAAEEYVNRVLGESFGVGKYPDRPDIGIAPDGKELKFPLAVRKPTGDEKNALSEEGTGIVPTMDIREGMKRLTEKHKKMLHGLRHYWIVDSDGKLYARVGALMGPDKIEMLETKGGVVAFINLVLREVMEVGKDAERPDMGSYDNHEYRFPLSIKENRELDTVVDFA